MFIEQQYLNKILDKKEYPLLLEPDLTEEYFPSYVSEYKFIKDHYEKNGLIPDSRTFLDRFPKFELFEVNETNAYLVDKIRELHLYNRMKPIVEEGTRLANEDSNLGLAYFMKELSIIPTTVGVDGEDIIHGARKRLETLIDRHNNRDKYFFQTGLKELDMVTGGIQRKDELAVLFARTNNGKSWISEKIAITIWESGYNVGYFSPEMSGESIGYRFDTMYKHFSNSMLVNAYELNEIESYEKYINELMKHKNIFDVTTPKSFSKNPTVSAIKNWIITKKLDFVVLDGISYMKDERGKRGDNKTTSLTNICQDLMTLSGELSIPFLAVVQANREAVGDKDDVITVPTLETIRDSDGIAHVASKVFSMRKTRDTVELVILKQRNGVVGGRLLWDWDVDKGFFQYKPNRNSGLEEYDAKISNELSSKFQDTADPTSVF